MLGIGTAGRLRQAMGWPFTGLVWMPTSPDVLTFETALVYPGMGRGSRDGACRPAEIQPSLGRAAVRKTHDVSCDQRHDAPPRIGGDEIIASLGEEVERCRLLRVPYLIY